MRASLTRAIALHATHRYPEGQTHGHLYRIECTVAGTMDPVTNMVIDLNVLDEILTQQVTIRLRAQHLNAVIPSGAHYPTCEAIAAWCWQEVADRLPQHVLLERVRVAEDETLWAECTGPT